MAQSVMPFSERRRQVAVFVDDHESLPFDRLDAFRRHVGFVIGVFAFEDLHLVGFERRPGVAFDAADPFALRDVAGETLAQQVGAYDFVVYLDHLRQVSAMMMS